MARGCSDSTRMLLLGCQVACALLFRLLSIICGHRVCAQRPLANAHTSERQGLPQLLCPAAIMERSVTVHSIREARWLLTHAPRACTYAQQGSFQLQGSFGSMMSALWPLHAPNWRLVGVLCALALCVWGGRPCWRRYQKMEPGYIIIGMNARNCLGAASDPAKPARGCWYTCRANSPPMGAHTSRLLCSRKVGWRVGEACRALVLVLGRRVCSWHLSVAS